MSTIFVVAFLQWNIYYSKYFLYIGIYQKKK